LTFASWVAGRGVGRGQNCIGNQICKICADGNYGTFSYELLVGAERVQLLHEQRNSLDRNGSNLVQ